MHSEIFLNKFYLKMHPNSVLYSKIYAYFDIYMGIFYFDLKFSPLAPNA